MRITSKGQVTIPLAIREQAGFLPNTEVEFDYDGNAVRIRRILPGKGRKRVPVAASGSSRTCARTVATGR